MMNRKRRRKKRGGIKIYKEEGKPNEKTLGKKE